MFFDVKYGSKHFFLCISLCMLFNDTILWAGYIQVQTILSCFSLRNKHYRSISCKLRSLFQVGIQACWCYDPTFIISPMCYFKKSSIPNFFTSFYLSFIFIRPDLTRSAQISPDQTRLDQIIPDRTIQDQIGLDRTRGDQLRLVQNPDLLRSAQIFPDWLRSSQIGPYQSRSAHISPGRPRSMIILFALTI